MIVVEDGLRKWRVKVNSNGSYQKVEVQFVSEKMIFWKRTMPAFSRRSGQTSEGWHAGRRRSRLLKVKKHVLKKVNHKEDQNFLCKRKNFCCKLQYP